MTTITIVRLKNGEDIIGNVRIADDGLIYMQEPMTVDVVQKGNESGLVMSHWLPVQLIKKNEIILKPNDILTSFEPNADFCEYYVNTVRKISELMKAKEAVDNMTGEEIETIMEAIKDGSGKTLH